MGFDDACLECHAYVTLGKRSLHAAPLTTVSAPSSSRPRSSPSLQSLAVFIPSPWPTTPAYRYTYSSPSSAFIAHRIPPTGVAQVYPGILAHHSDRSPSLPGVLPPRRYLWPCFLLFHVCSCLCVLSHPHPDTDAPVRHSLPKEKIPARELAVASTASLLGGFGVVALFCSVGVYV